MMNSIFKKMLVSAIAFSIGSLLCSTFIIGFLLEKQIYNRTLTTLESKALDLHEEVKRFLNGEIGTDEIKDTIVTLHEQENIQVSIMTKEKEALFTNENADVQKWIGEVLEKDAEFVNITFHKNKQIHMFIVSVPILVENENKGAIFLYTPMEEAEELMLDINKIIAFSVLLLIGPIVLICWLLSKKLVSPIVSMSETVTKISKGDFEHKLTLKGRDEIVALGESINSMAERLAVIEQSRKRFIGEISHELRTPLTTIRSTIQGISDGIFSADEEEEFIRISVNEIKRISKLIDDLTDLSALEEKAVILQKEKTSITELLDTCILSLTMQAKEKEIVIEKMSKKNIYARVDVDRMKQVLLNLIDNAIKHSYHQSKIKITLTKNTDSIGIHMENSGEPIPSDVLPHLFDRFFKTDQSRSQKGNGLGLTIAKKIVELHHGRISVQARKSNIEFTVNIPYDL